MNTTQIPFKLVDPSDGTTLKHNDSFYIGNSSKYQIHTINNKNIVNFNPEINITKGAYSNQNAIICDTHLHATGKNFPLSYKSKAIKKLYKYFNPADVIIDLGCSNGECLSKLPENLIKIGVDISPSSMFEMEPNVLDSNIHNLWICDATKLPCLIHL